MKSNSSFYQYAVGDLVELARYGHRPENDEDRVYGTVIKLLDPTDYRVPVYHVRVQHKRSQGESHLDKFVLGPTSNPKKVVSVFEYDIAGKTKGDSQA